MNGSDTAANNGLSSASVLCRRYHLAIFRAAEVPSAAAPRQKAQMVVWAIGFLRDGHWELLGAWNSTPRPSPSCMEAVFADLYNRGAEWFDFVVSPFPESTAFDTAAVRMGARTLPSIELGISAASEFFSARARAVAGKKLRFISEARSSQEMVEAVARVAESPWGKDHPDLVERWRSVSSSWHDIFQLPVRSRRTYREADRLGSDLQGVIRRAMKRYRDFANGVDPLRFVLSSLKGAEGKRRRKVLDVGGADSRLVFSHYRSVAGPGLVVIASDLRMGRV